jgi:hypothetical protein
MKTETNRYPDIVLERYLLGELEPGKMEEIRRRAEADEALRQKLECLRRSDGEILDEYPPETIVPGIQKKIDALPEERKARRRWRPLPALSFAAALSALSALFIVFALPALRTAGAGGLGEPSDVIRYKGDSKFASPSLAVYRLKGDTAELLKDGAAARAGDIVQLRYNALAKRYGAIVSIDGRGAVTQHFPFPPSTDVALERAEALLPRSFELDDAPEFEIFFFVTADAPFDPGLVLERARSLARSGNAARTRALDLPAGFTQSSLLLAKENNQP